MVLTQVQTGEYGVTGLSREELCAVLGQLLDNPAVRVVHCDPQVPRPFRLPTRLPPAASVTRRTTKANPRGKTELLGELGLFRLVTCIATVAIPSPEGAVK